MWASRLFHLRFLKPEPMLAGILAVLRVPPQSTFWRFLASLHLGVARQLLQVQGTMRERVWEAANVRLREVTLDTDTTVHSCAPPKKSYQPRPSPLPRNGSERASVHPQEKNG